MAKSPEGNARSRDAVSREHKLTLTGARLPVRKGQMVGVTRGDLSDSVGILINIQRLTLRSQFCFDKTFIGGQNATIVITCTD